MVCSMISNCLSRVASLLFSLPAGKRTANNQKIEILIKSTPRTYFFYLSYSLQWELLLLMNIQLSTSEHTGSALKHGPVTCFGLEMKWKRCQGSWSQQKSAMTLEVPGKRTTTLGSPLNFAWIRNKLCFKTLSLLVCLFFNHSTIESILIYILRNTFKNWLNYIGWPTIPVFPELSSSGDTGPSVLKPGKSLMEKSMEKQSHILLEGVIFV